MALGIAMGIAKVGMGGVNMLAGMQASNQAMRDAARFGQQIANTEFVNKFAALQAPDKGARLALESVNRSAQQTTEAAKEGGLRGVVGSAGRVQQGVTDAAAKIAAQLDEVQLQIDNKFLSEEQKTDLRNKQKNLQLYASRLQGAQAAGAAGSTQAMAGLGQMASGAFSAIAGGIEKSNLYKKDDANATFTDDSGTIQTLSKKQLKEDDKIASRYQPGGKRGKNDLSGMQNIERKMDIYNTQNDGVTSGAGIQLSDEDAKLLNMDFSQPEKALQLLPEDDVDISSFNANLGPFGAQTPTQVMNQGIDKLYDDDELFMLDPSNTSINAAGLRVTN